MTLAALVAILAVVACARARTNRASPRRGYGHSYARGHSQRALLDGAAHDQGVCVGGAARCTANGTSSSHVHHVDLA
jgi:hypothetical protein